MSLIFIWILLSFLPSKSYSYGMEFDFDTSILTYEYKYHFHLPNQMYGTEVDFGTCILFLMLIRIVLPGCGTRVKGFNTKVQGMSMMDADSETWMPRCTWKNKILQ